MRLEELTFDLVQSLIGSSFRTPIEGRPEVELKIVDVCKVMERVESKKLTRQPFSIYFLGPPDILLHQGTRSMRHEQLGEMEIFMVPISKKEDGFEYEAVFT